ncbi:MAG: ion channel [Firmicutes bacterium]|jgi:hypothetical protein|nr:ion channel [Bacillota bacterium]
MLNTKIDVKRIEIIDECFDSNSVTWMEKSRKKQLMIKPRTKSVEVTFSNGEKRRYGYVDSLDNNTEGLVNLNCSYIHNLNLSNTDIQITAENSFIVGGIDFTQSCISGDKANFKNAIFYNGTVKFNNSVFNCEKVIFNNVRFIKNNINFNSATFNVKEINFEESIIFSKYVSFKNANLNSSFLSFRSVDFCGSRLNFESVKVTTGNINFRYSTNIGNTINFRWAELNSGEVCFRNINSPTTMIRFVGSSINSRKITFESSILDQVVFDYCECNCYIDLRVKKTRLVILDSCVIHNILDLNFVDRNSVTGLSVNNSKILGQIYIDWMKYSVKELIENGKLISNKNDDYNELNLSLEQIAKQLLMLKENYQRIGLYDYEDLCYVEYRRVESIALVKNTKDKNIFAKVLGLSKFLVQKFIFDLVGGYGTKPTSVFKTMIAVWLGFSALYSFEPLQLDYVGVSSSLDKIKPLYFSGITFLTIGYGDIKPSNDITALVSIIEGFMGIFLMSYFTVSFARKLLR